MAASSGSPPKPRPVPAWKRLGLKLKYAKEDAPFNSLPTSNTAIGSQHPIGDGSAKEDSEQDVRPQKKRRISPDAPNEPQQAVAKRAAGDSSPRHQAVVDLPLSENRTDPFAESDDRNYELQIVNDSSVVHANQNSERVVHANTEKTRKSVTFTTDTKQQDGFSASSLYEQWSPGQNSDQDQPNLLAVRPPSKKAQKQQRRTERTEGLATLSSHRNSRELGDSDPTSNESVPEFLAYLQLFHTDRQSWKFNKKKQNDLLKNLFNIERIPAEHNEAIFQYIAGLQGAGARQRLIENARAVLTDIVEKTDDYDELLEDMESEEARRAAYYAALQRQLELYEHAKVIRTEYDDQQIEEMRRKAETGRRAEAVLEELLQNKLDPEQVLPAPTEDVQRSTPNPGVNSQSLKATEANTPSTEKLTSKRKKRKTRTAAPSSDDSESDKTSDTSESESAGKYNPKHGPATIHEALSARSDLTTAQKKSKPSFSLPKSTGTRIIFDEELLDKAYPRKQTYHETAPKRKAGEKSKARGFAYTHGTKADESGSEDDD